MRSLYRIELVIQTNPKVTSAGVAGAWAGKSREIAPMTTLTSPPICGSRRHSGAIVRAADRYTRCIAKRSPERQARPRANQLNTFLQCQWSRCRRNFAAKAQLAGIHMDGLQWLGLQHDTLSLVFSVVWVSAPQGFICLLFPCVYQQYILQYPFSYPFALMDEFARKRTISNVVRPLVPAIWL